MDNFDPLSEIPEHKVEDVNILFLDASSTCTGYCVVNVNFTTKKCVVKTAGAIWLPDVDHQEKYAYVYNALLNYFNIVERVDYIVAEQYSINPKRMVGVLVSIELHGAIKVAGAEMGVKVKTFPPQSWRKELGAKRNPVTADWKQPVKDKVLELVKVPDKVMSNVSKNMRQTPSDLYDAIGLAVGFLRRINLHNIDFSQTTFQTHVGVIEEM